MELELLLLSLVFGLIGGTVGAALGSLGLRWLERRRGRRTSKQRLEWVSCDIEEGPFSGLRLFTHPSKE